MGWVVIVDEFVVCFGFVYDVVVLIVFQVFYFFKVFVLLVMLLYMLVLFFFVFEKFWISGVECIEVVVC